MTSPGLGPIPQRRRSADGGSTPGTSSTPSVSLPPPLGPMQTLRLEITSLQRKSGLDAALNPDDYIRHLAPGHLVDLSKELYSIVKRVLKMKRGERQRTLDPEEAHMVRAHHNGSRDGLTESATATRGGTAISTVESEDTDTDEDRSALNIEVTTPTLREVDASCLIPLLELEKNSDTDDDDDHEDGGKGRDKRSKSMKSVTMTHPDETDVDHNESGQKPSTETFTILGPYELLQTPALGEPLLGTIRPGRPKGSFDGVPATVVVRSIPASCLKRHSSTDPQSAMQDSGSLLGDTAPFSGQSPAVSTSAISLALSIPGGSLDNLIHLQRHAATIKRLKHKNLVPVQEVMEDKDNLYVVSQLSVAASTTSITPHTSGIFQISGSARSLLHHGNANPINGGLTREDTGVASPGIGSPNSISFAKGAGLVADHIFELDESGEVVRPLPDVMKVRGYIRQIANALRYLELHRVVHLDLKPNNVFVSGDEIQIADYALNGFLDVQAWRPGAVRNQKLVSEVFGGSEVNSPRDREESGSPLRRHLKAPSQVELPAFMAPELCLWDPETSPPLTSSADVWSLGVLLYCMLLGRLPFRGANAGAMMMSILQDEPEFPEDDSIDPAWVDLLRGMLEKTPDDRITLGALLRHPFLKTRSDSMGRGGFLSSRDEFLTSGGPTARSANGEDPHLSHAELESAILSLNAIPAQRMKSPRKPPLAPGGTPRSTSRRASSSFGSSFNSSTNSVTGGLIGFPSH